MAVVTPDSTIPLGALEKILEGAANSYGVEIIQNKTPVYSGKAIPLCFLYSVTCFT